MGQDYTETLNSSPGQLEGERIFHGQVFENGNPVMPLRADVETAIYHVASVAATEATADAVKNLLAGVINNGVVQTTATIAGNVTVNNVDINDRANRLLGKTTISGKDVLDVSLQSAATATGNGTVLAPAAGNYTLTFEVKGTSTSRGIAFEIAGPSGVYQSCKCFRITDMAMDTCTTGGSDTLPEIWQVDVPCGCSFRARILAIAGGSVTVAGKAVMI
jgi:hypothetical protein